MSDKEFNIITILAVILSIICLTVAFAALNTTISISAETTLKQASWNINFQTPFNLSNSVNARWLDNPIGGAVEGEPTVIGTTLYFQAVLDDKGEYVSFDIPVKNSGTIDAILSNVATSISGDDSDLLILTIKDSNGDELANGSMTLNNGETKNVTITATFDPEAVTTLETDSDVLIQVTLLWEQN